MPQINYKQIRENLAKQSLKQVKALAKGSALSKFNSAYADLLEDFNEHPVTQEIEGGENAQNISNTLDNKGNLWGFIGFEQGSNPIAPIRKALRETDIDLDHPIVKNEGNQVKLSYKISYPSFEELEELAPMPWEAGRSWIRGIETFISGLSSFMYWRRDGRSGAGLQAKTRGGGNQILRATEYHKTSYLSVIISKFKKRFK